MMIVCVVHLVMDIRFDQESQSVIEGDVVTISVVADHISEVNVTIFILVTPDTASGKMYYFCSIDTFIFS